jgi:hypothetical protein
MCGGSWRNSVYEMITVSTVKAASDLEKCSGKKCNGYRGNQNKTRSGKTCMMWADQSPHKHTRGPEKRPGMGTEGKGNNKCRNPDNGDTIWCYTTDPKKRFEYCDPIKTTKADRVGHFINW